LNNLKKDIAYDLRASHDKAEQKMQRVLTNSEAMNHQQRLKNKKVLQRQIDNAWSVETF
jgi:hypothetical protein